MVWVAGFEPAASAFQARPSNLADITPRLIGGRGSEAFMMAVSVKTIYKQCKAEVPKQSRANTTKTASRSCVELLLDI